VTNHSQNKPAAPCDTLAASSPLNLPGCSTHSVFVSRLWPAHCSIRQRAEALQRGLSDDSAGVRKACCQLLQETWLQRDCQGDLVRLLSLLDVENHEEVGQLVMKELAATDGLKEILSSGASLRDFVGALQGAASVGRAQALRCDVSSAGGPRGRPCQPGRSDWTLAFPLCYFATAFRTPRLLRGSRWCWPPAEARGGLFLEVDLCEPCSAGHGELASNFVKLC